MEHLSVQELKNLQQIFIEQQDWDEVSKIQFRLDTKEPAKKKYQFEDWFRAAWAQYVLEETNSFLNVLIYYLERRMNEVKR
jgi:hypothetical protein